MRGESAVPKGDHQVWMEFAYDGGRLGAGGGITPYVDGVEVGSGRIENTEPIGFGAEYTDVGRDSGSPVTKDYAIRDNAFTGTIKLIEHESGTDSRSHLIDPESVINFAMAKQ